MADLIFNKDTDRYIFTGSRLRAPPSRGLRLSTASDAYGTYIDICNNGIVDISAGGGVFVNGYRVVTTSSGASTSLTGLQLSQNLDVSGTITSDGGIQIGSGSYGGKIYKTENPNELVIDPFTIDASNNISDASGQVTIMGDLVVRGNTTTISSTNVDISDVLLTLASGGATGNVNNAGIALGTDGYASMLWNSSRQKWTFNKGVDISDANLTLGSGSGAPVNGGGLVLGTNATASMLWNSARQKWTFNKGVDISDVRLTFASGSAGSALNDVGIEVGSDAYASMLWNSTKQRWVFNRGIEVSGNILPTAQFQSPTSASSVSVKYPGNLGGDQLGDVSGWTDASGWTISRNLLSKFSVIKLDYSVYYSSSPEAGQTLGFRFLRSVNDGVSYDTTTPVISHASIGSEMGVTSFGVYSGSFTDNINNRDMSSNFVYYKLQFNRNCPANDTISTPFGIRASTGNSLVLQELYGPGTFYYVY